MNCHDCKHLVHLNTEEGLADGYCCHGRHYRSYSAELIHDEQLQSKEYRLKHKRCSAPKYKQAKIKWQPISSAPKDGTFVLLCRAVDADGKRMTGDDFRLFVQVAAWWLNEGDKEGGEWTVYCSLVREPRLHFEPTHWTPLPSAPKH